MNNLAKRIVSAVVLIPVALAAIWFGGVGLALLLSLLAGVGAWELFRMARAQGIDAFAPIGIALAAGLPLGVHATAQGWLDRPLAAGGVLLVALFGLAVWTRAPTERPLESVAIATFGVLYAGGTLAFGYALRHHRWVVGNAAGTALLMYPVLLTWAADIGAYAFGRWLGRRKLHPTVSPGKTVAGAVGGTALAVVAAVAYNTYVLHPTAQLALAPWTAPIFGVVVSVVAQVGDLAESLVKREAGVKDSSGAIPGHGGVLDRLDSLYFVLPVSYLVLGRLLLAAPT